MDKKIKKNKTDNKMAGAIVLLCAIVFFIGSVILCIRDKNIYIEDFVCALGLAVFGISLLKKRIKFYGIGVGAVIGFTIIVDAIFDGRWMHVATFTVLTGAAIVAVSYINTKTNKPKDSSQKRVTKK